MLQGLFVLLACQLAGEVIVRGFGVPIPGPVVGIVILFVGLMVRDRFSRAPNPDVEPHVARMADNLLKNLGLVFVPAGVGIAQNYNLVLANGLPIVVSLVASTILTLIVTMAVFRLVARWTEARA